MWSIIYYMAPPLSTNSARKEIVEKYIHFCASYVCNRYKIIVPSCITKKFVATKTDKSSYPCQGCRMSLEDILKPSVVPKPAKEQGRPDSGKVLSS